VLRNHSTSCCSCVPRNDPISLCSSVLRSGLIYCCSFVPHNLICLMQSHFGLHIKTLCCQHGAVTSLRCNFLWQQFAACFLRYSSVLYNFSWRLLLLLCLYSNSQCMGSNVRGSVGIPALSVTAVLLVQYALSTFAPCAVCRRLCRPPADAFRRLSRGLPPASLCCSVHNGLPFGCLIGLSGGFAH